MILKSSDALSVILARLLSVKKFGEEVYFFLDRPDDDDFNVVTEGDEVDFSTTEAPMALVNRSLVS